MKNLRLKTSRTFPIQSGPHIQFIEHFVSGENVPFANVLQMACVLHQRDVEELLTGFTTNCQANFGANFWNDAKLMWIRRVCISWSPPIACSESAAVGGARLWHTREEGVLKWPPAFRPSYNRQMERGLHFSAGHDSWRALVEMSWRTKVEAAGQSCERLLCLNGLCN